MGYRSDVCILLNKGAVEMMTDEVKKAFDSFHYKEVKTYGDGHVLYRIPGVKWFPTFYKEAATIEKWLQWIDDGCDGDNEYVPTFEEMPQHEFARVGEGDDDTEQWGNADKSWLCIEDGFIECWLDEYYLDAKKTTILNGKEV